MDSLASRGGQLAFSCCRILISGVATEPSSSGRCMLKRFRIPEMVLGALFSAPLWALVWAWTDSYAPTEKQKQECYEAAQKTGQKGDECKTFWERTTSDPVAFFTLVLAFSTVGLWGATIALYLSGEKQIGIATKTANAAELSAQALMNAERARLFVAIQTENISTIVGRGGFFNKSESMFKQELQSPGIGYLFKNVGKTAAILKEVSEQIIVKPEFPIDAPYSVREQPEDLVIEPGKAGSTFACIMRDTLTVGDAVGFEKRKLAFWFYGYVKFNDAFGREHRFEYRYCYRRGFAGPRLEYYRELTKETD
jgi:hypothetical protein